MTGAELPADDPAIHDDDVLLRRIPSEWLRREESGGLRPASAAFQDITAPDGTRAMSVYVERLLEEHGLERADVLEGRSDLGIVAFSAAAARDAGMTVYFSPHEGPLGHAHADVAGKKRGSVQKKLVAASEIVLEPSESV